MKNQLYHYTFIALIFFSVIPLKSQTIQKKYDLDFRDVAFCSRSWLSSINCNFLLDSTDLYESKPVFKLYYNKLADDKTMHFDLSKLILLPENSQQNKCEVSVFSRDNVNNDCYLKVTAIDKDEKEISSKSIRINSENWKEKTVNISVLNAKAIRISIYYMGDSTISQNVCINGLSIKINGKDIAEQNYFSKRKEDSLKVVKSLDRKHIRPLTVSNDSTLLANINEFKGKKVFGIAESTHGSASIQKASYQFIKNLIVNNNCKLVLLEKGTDRSLLMGLYVLGMVPDSYLLQIIDTQRSSIGGYEQLVDFLKWLRAYNSNLTNKIHLLGMDFQTNPQLYLFEYHLALLGEERGRFYLKKIAKKKYNEVIKFAQTDSVMKNKLDKQNFDFYLSFLKNERVAPDFQDNFENRDEAMFKRVQNFMKIYLKAGETVAIYAHSGHLKKIPQSKGFLKNDIPLGYYLRKEFNKQYFSVSFQIAEGKYIQDECSIYGGTIVDSLKNPPPYSFEFAGLSTKVDYFYYRSKNMGDFILSYCNINRTSRYADLYQFSSLKKRFDAYVFIKESKPIQNVERYPSLYLNDSNYKRKQAMENLNKELGN